MTHLQAKKIALDSFVHIWTLTGNIKEQKSKSAALKSQETKQTFAEKSHFQTLEMETSSH